MILDESMGAIGGQLNPFHAYDKYRNKIQDICENGVVNSMNFNFRISIRDNIIDPEGGIRVTDLRKFDEIEVEAAGLPYEIIESFP